MIHLLALLALLSFSSANSLNDLDKRISSSLEGSNRYPLLDISVEVIALGTPAVEWGWILSQWRSGESSEREDIYEIAAFSMLTTYALTGITKYAVGRERPDRRYKPRLWNTRITPSFPSGHVAASAAWAAVASRHSPAKAPLSWSYVALSAWSQIYVGNHYFSDVVVGALLGAVIGSVVHEKMWRDPNSVTPDIVLSFRF
ncbi:MAG: phosphatase PAP2 family protein [Candidatus Neomarinimicrobiota bacterium]|nr:phosphatase PAP2 family protein [Candidatus Neomarinimicrobiota bacterium]